MISAMHCRKCGYALLAAVLMCLWGAGCTQDPSLDLPADNGGDQPGAPTTTQPVTSDTLVEGPGFTVTVPSSFTLIEDQSSHPGILFFRQFTDDFSLYYMTVSVITPSEMGVSQLDSVSYAFDKAIRTATGDFMLVLQGNIDYFFGQADYAYGMLADGNLLCVAVTGLHDGGIEELLATNLWLSVDMFDTDGDALIDNIRDNSSTIMAVGDKDMIVLDDMNVWRLYADSTQAAQDQFDAWQNQDLVWAAMTREVNGLVQTVFASPDHWIPVAMYRSGQADEKVIATVANNVLTFEGGGGYGVGPDFAALCQPGDVIYVVTFENATWLIHALTGTTATAPSEVIAGPGFTLKLPQVPLERVENIAAPDEALFWKAYIDTLNGVIYAVSVDPVPPDDNGSLAVDGLDARVRGDLVTTTGDWMLVGRYAGNAFGSFEADMAIGRLANGTLLSIMVLADNINLLEQFSANTLFRSVDMFDTDGRSLENLLADDSTTLAVSADDGTVILDDLTAWELPYGASPADSMEYNGWQAGDQVFAQSYTPQWAIEETWELVHAGNWLPVEVDYLGLAEKTTIIAIPDAWTVATADGSIWVLNTPVHATWAVGDTLYYIGRDDFMIDDRMIHENTGDVVSLD